eukprot:523640-Pelagomonas_calceolata.AAC.1
MMGTKESVSGVVAPVMLVLWVVVQRGSHLFLSYQGPLSKGRVDVGWQGTRKGFCGYGAPTSPHGWIGDRWVKVRSSVKYKGYKGYKGKKGLSQDV